MTGLISTAARGVDIQGADINTGVAWRRQRLVYRWTGILVFFLVTGIQVDWYFIALGGLYSTFYSSLS